MNRAAGALRADVRPFRAPTGDLGPELDQLCFDQFAVDPAKRLLTRDGAPVEIGGRTFDLLLALVEQRGRVVPKRELLQRVWPDAVVEDSALRFHMTRLRRILDDGREGVRLITTQVSVGYAFVGAVARRRPAPSPARLTAQPSVRVPSRLDRVIGRDDDLEALIERAAAVRLLTIVGPAGVGKTSLAIEIAHALQPRFADGVDFVDLASVEESERLPAAIAEAVCLGTDAHRSTEALLRRLRGREQLLVLDNCEHLVHAVAGFVEQVASAAPGVHVVATSRQALRTRNEQVHRLAPYDITADLSTVGRDDLLDRPAVALFLHHLTAAGGAVVEELETLRTIARICARLDGVALAIELAAVRAATHGVEATARLLGGELCLLWPGRRTASPRQRTLKATLDWSYALLSETERRVFERLSRLPAPFSLETALGTVTDETLEIEDAVAALDGLVEKSLIRPRDGEYHWAEFIQVYARERLSKRPPVEGRSVQSPMFRMVLCPERSVAVQRG